MQTERVDFPDGAWWEFQAHLSHGTARRVADVMRGYLKAVEGKDAVDVDWASLDLQAMHEAMVLGGTVAWSYGPVDVETLNREVPEEHFSQVLTRMNRLYGGVAGSPLAPNGVKPSVRRFSPRSLVAALFHRS